MDWVFADDVVIVRSSSGPVGDTLWSSMMEEIRARRPSRVFAVTSGDTTVSSQQRQLAGKVMNELRLSAIVVTDSRLSRGMITAISWLGPKFTAFAWRDFESALSLLGPTARQREEIVRRVRALRPDAP